MHLPAVSDRKVIRQYLTAHENKAILAEMTVGRAVVDILDQIAVGGGALRQKGRQLIGVFEFFKIIAAMGSGRPTQNDGCEAKRGVNRRRRQIGIGFLAQDFRNPATRNSRQQVRDNASRVVRWILPGSLTTGLPSRPARSAANGNTASAWSASEIRLTTTCTSSFSSAVST